MTNLPADAFNRTVSRFNGFARSGRDDDFHRGESAHDCYYGDPTNKPNPSLGELTVGPTTRPSWCPLQLNGRYVCPKPDQEKRRHDSSRLPCDRLTDSSADKRVIHYFSYRCAEVLGPERLGEVPDCRGFVSTRLKRLEYSRQVINSFIVRTARDEFSRDSRTDIIERSTLTHRQDRCSTSHCLDRNDPEVLDARHHQRTASSEVLEQNIVRYAAEERRLRTCDLLEIAAKTAGASDDETYAGPLCGPDG